MFKQPRRPRIALIDRFYQIIKTTGSLLILAVIPVAISGCATDKFHERNEKSLEDSLKYSAQQFWNAIRWGQYEKAVEYLEDGPEKTQLLEHLLGGQSITRFSDIDIYSTNVDIKNKEGIVSVRYQIFLTNEGSIHNRFIQQTWTFHSGSWYLKYESDDIFRLNSDR